MTCHREPHLRKAFVHLLTWFMSKAKNHGNEPSKGAKIDAEIQAEEEEILKKKGAFGPKT